MRDVKAVDWLISRSLNDVGIYIGAVCVREVADRLQIVLEPVVHRDMRYLDEASLLIHHLLEIAHFDPPIASRHNSKIEAKALLQRLQVKNGPLKVKSVGYDVPPDCGIPRLLTMKFSPVLVLGIYEFSLSFAFIRAANSTLIFWVFMGPGTDLASA